MKTAVFKPSWMAFDLPPIAESVGTSLALPVVIRATMMLDPWENRVKIQADDALALSRVMRNGVEEVNYTIEDGILTIAGSDDELTVLELDRTGEITFSIFAGQIVPGISISDDGRLKGIVANIPFKQTHDYRFGVRARWGKKIADVIKTWSVSPADNQLSWNTETLPSPELDSSKVSGRAYYTIGEFRRGQMVEVDIDVLNPDATPVEVLFRSTSEVKTGPAIFNGKLPLGLKLSNGPTRISGFIPAEGQAGDYFFEVYIDEPFGPTPILMHVKLLGDQFDNFTAVNRISWLTDAKLGSIKEGHPVTLSVRAENSNGSGVTYHLAPGSRPLPTGMFLTTSGELRGVAPHVSVTETIQEFSVKASSGTYVSSKTFSFKLLRSFEQPRHLTVSLPLSGPMKAAWRTYKGAIPLQRKFRSTDLNFGGAEPAILLIDGLRALTVSALDYDAPLDLIMGPFRVAKFEQDGVHVCDVIYREFFDPMIKAGGFVPNNPDVIEDPVYYPQDQSRRINESTVHNLRSDLVVKVGLNSSKKKTLGIDGGELLPLWMTTKQVNGARLGYVSAAVIDYVQPGRGETIIRTLDYGLAPVGTVTRLDRLIVSEGLAGYYFYLGWDNRNGGNSYINPISPTNLLVDGTDANTNTSLHREPTISWSSSQTEVSFKLMFFSGTKLIRTENGLTAAAFTYTQAMQAEDNNPGHVRVEVYSVHDELSSPPLVGDITLRVGWGYGWGLHYGGSV